MYSMDVERMLPSVVFEMLVKYFFTVTSFVIITTYGAIPERRIFIKKEKIFDR